MKHQVFALLVNFLLNYVFSQETQVKTKYGWLEGNYSTTRGGRQIIEFLGIKYAKSPTGELRFKSPVPVDPWKGVKQATKQCDACMQQMVVVQSLRNIVPGSEDCLCLNVYTPSVSPCKKLPVIFFIHGGGYAGFSSDKTSYGPELLLDKDVVLVTMNYRLGVLGYLSTEDEVIPGNFAMKDQVAALRWVRDNIAQFGGDPNSITLMGESSGAATVHLHMLSPLSQGLFHKGIIQSGSGLCPWGVAEKGVLKKRAATLASYIGCPFNTSAEFLSCLQKTPAKKIVETTNRYLTWDLDPVVIWNPVVESARVKDAFLTKSPRFLTTNKPLLAGFNFAEGGIKTLSITVGDVDKTFDEWNKNFEKLTASSLGFDETAPDPTAVTKAIRSFYFGSVNQITPEMTTPITQLFGDLWFANGVLDAVERNKAKSYLYFFNFNTSSHFSLWGSLLNNPLYLGACHFDELSYLFPMNGSYKIVDPDLSNKMVDLWTSFVSQSNPSTEHIVWNPVGVALDHLVISNGNIGMATHPIQDRRRFYKTLQLRK